MKMMNLDIRLCAYLIGFAGMGAIAVTSGCKLETCIYNGSCPDGDAGDAGDAGDTGDTGDTGSAGIPEPPGHNDWHMACLNTNDPDYNWFQTQGNSMFRPNPMHVCAVWDGDDPTTGTPEEEWDEIVRTACTEKCVDLANNFSYECTNAQWSKVAPAAGDYSPCPPEGSNLDYDVIENMLGSSAALAVADLPCELAMTCDAFLDIDAQIGLRTMSGAAAALTAETAVVTTTGTLARSRVEVGITGTDVVGEAAYTAVTCGSDACPFYLAHLELSQSVPWTTYVVFPGTTSVLTKEASDMVLSLELPTLGIWLPSSGAVIFPPGSLTLRAQVDVGGLTNTYSENGSYNGAATNDEYIVGMVTFGVGSSTLVINAGGTNLLGSWAVVGDFTTP